MSDQENTMNENLNDAAHLETAVDIACESFGDRNSVDGVFFDTSNEYYVVRFDGGAANASIHLFDVERRLNASRQAIFDDSLLRPLAT